MIKIGTMIGDRYEVLERIGMGGMSDVYKAKDHKLNRHVAVKVLKQEFSENTNFVSKFRVEAQAAASLMHPNIVNVYDVGEDNGVYYIVMELVDGITLKKYIEKKARLSVREALSIAIQACMGIEAAHNNHIIHRDIKPQNIIISKDGKVKVTDFGIAKRRRATRSPQMSWVLCITLLQSRQEVDTATKRVIFIHLVLLYMRWLPDVFHLTEIRLWQSLSNIFRKKWFRRVFMRKICHTALSRSS